MNQSVHVLKEMLPPAPKKIHQGPSPPPLPPPTRSSKKCQAPSLPPPAMKKLILIN